MDESRKLRMVLHSSRDYASRLGAVRVEPIHLFLSLLDLQDELMSQIKSLGISSSILLECLDGDRNLMGEYLGISDESKQIIEYSNSEAQKLGKPIIERLMCNILKASPQNLHDCLFKNRVDSQFLIRYIDNIR